MTVPQTRVSGGGSSHQGSDSGYILNVDPMVFADGLNVVCERKGRQGCLQAFGTRNWKNEVSSCCESAEKLGISVCRVSGEQQEPGFGDVRFGMPVIYLEMEGRPWDICVYHSGQRSRLESEIWECRHVGAI